MKKYTIAALLLCCTLFNSGCTTAKHYTQQEFEANQGNPPKMLFGVLKVYPENAMKILSTPMMLSPEAARSSSSTPIYGRVTVSDSKGNSTTYKISGYVR